MRLLAAAALALALTGCGSAGGPQVGGSDSARRGERLIVRYGCGGCHTIPGVRGANGRVGPELDDLRGQRFIAGVLPSSPENAARWIEDPKRFSPRTVMPDVGVTPAEARDIAAYLYDES